MLQTGFFFFLFFCQKNALLLVFFLYYDYKIRSQLSISTHFRIQGGGPLSMTEGGQTDVQKSLGLILDILIQSIWIYLSL